MFSATIQIRRELLGQLAAAARSTPREECCGLLAGRDGIITALYSARNALASPRAYEIAPDEHFRILHEIRSAQLELLGIYHSHPHGENRPSPTDIVRAYYPDAAYLIVSSQLDAPTPIRAFRIVDGTVTELRIAPM
jgi:[CysO sulfur-carrier protein]-S-L-cysteine hydrolase